MLKMFILFYLYFPFLICLACVIIIGYLCLCDMKECIQKIKKTKKRWINYVKRTVAFDFVDFMVVLCFGNNWIGGKEKLKC